MASTFNLRALITAVDRLSPVLRAQMRVMGQWRRSMESAGRGGVPMAIGLGAALAIPTKAFVDAENAAMQLKNTLMNKDGVSGGFENLSQLAVELGNQLPGTTADFMSMASQLKSLGMNTESLLNGALKSTAYLAVVGGKLGVTYESAALAIGTLGNSMGIADKDLVGFADTLQRALHVGVDLTDLQYALSQSAGALKVVGQQGISVADDLVPLIALLSQAGIKGENAGTGLKKMIGVATKAGKFKTIPALVHDLEKLQKLNPAQMSKMLGDLFSEEHASKAGIIAAGGYDKVVAQFKEQASLQQRVSNSLGTLGNIWDAASGTFVNAMVAIAEAYAPELKALANKFNDLSGKLMVWAKANGATIKTVIKMSASFVGLKLGFLAAALGLRVLMQLLRSSPLMLIVQGIALLAPLIYDNWGKITEFLKSAWDGAINWIDERFQKFIDTLMVGVNAIRRLFNFGDIKVDLPKLAKITLPKDFVNHIQLQEKDGGGHWFKQPSDKSGASPTSPIINQGGFLEPSSYGGPVAPRSSFLQPVALRGAIDVNFHNAPAGMRVEQKGASSGLKIRQNVGFRTLGTA